MYIILRLLVAALHFNENGNKEQMCTKEAGNLMWKLSHPKSKQSSGVIKAVKVDSTYGKGRLQ